MEVKKRREVEEKFIVKLFDGYERVFGFIGGSGCMRIYSSIELVGEGRRDPQNWGSLSL